jgi:glycosyltransferase involved in cell wall biosynthesis
MSSPRPQPQVSVVIPARNAASCLSRVLGALGLQTAPRSRFEVVVVDDASTDDTSGVVRASGIARLVALRERRGVAAARNLGAADSRGALLAFLDADCVPGREWVERGIAELAREETDLLAGHIDMETGGRPSVVDLLAIGHDFDQQRYAAEGFSAGGNLWVRRAVFEELGGFRGDLLYGDEDREFALRARARGASLRYVPSVVVAHPPRGAVELARRSYRMAAARGRAGQRPMRARLAGGPYATRGYVRERLERAGYPSTTAKLARVQLAKYALIRAPMALGVLVGTVGRLRHRRAES